MFAFSFENAQHLFLRTHSHPLFPQQTRAISLQGFRWISMYIGFCQTWKAQAPRALFGQLSNNELERRLSYVHSPRGMFQLMLEMCDMFFAPKPLCYVKVEFSRGTNVCMEHSILGGQRVGRKSNKKLFALDQPFWPSSRLSFCSSINLSAV